MHWVYLWDWDLKINQIGITIQFLFWLTWKEFLFSVSFLVSPLGFPCFQILPMEPFSLERDWAWLSLSQVQEPFSCEISLVAQAPRILVLTLNPLLLLVNPLLIPLHFESWHLSWLSFFSDDHCSLNHQPWWSSLWW